MKDLEWTQEEMKLCLAFYIFDPKPTSTKNMKIFLPKMILKTGIVRSVGSIGRRVANYQTCDPKYSGIGLTGGGKKTQYAYDLYAGTDTALIELKKYYENFLLGNYGDVENVEIIEITKKSNIIEKENEQQKEYVNPVEDVINQIREKVIRKTSVYQRLPKVKEDTLDRAKGICEVCGEAAPFITKEGKPYLEVHHIIALSDEGVDHTSNTVALCPNCHRKMHYGDLSLEEENKIILKLLEATKKS